MRARLSIAALLVELEAEAIRFCVPQITLAALKP
jgi:hypothetical protein